MAVILYGISSGASGSYASTLGIQSFRVSMLTLHVPGKCSRNLGEAGRRSGQTENYRQNSGAFRYDKKSKVERKERELYIFVVGETGRAHNW